jgi:hypothetical protein
VFAEQPMSHEEMKAAHQKVEEHKAMEEAGARMDAGPRMPTIPQKRRPATARPKMLQG